MKKKIVSFALCLLMTGMMFGNIEANGGVYTGLTAGVSAALAQELETPEEILSELALVSQNEEEMVGVAEDGTFCGFTNLGIAIPDEGNLNVRSEPSTDGEIVGKMTYGAGCEVLEETKGWYHITSNEVDGYVFADYLVTGDEAMEIAQDEVTLTATVTDSGLRVREEASTDGEILYTIAAGEKLEVAEEEGDWIKVLVNDYEYAYVSSEYVTVAYEIPYALTMDEIRYGDSVSKIRAEICDYALRFVGYPYVWGGTSLTGGCDCSGYVLSIYAQIAGIYLPHSSRAQANYGTRISASEAQPGDLFFYGSGGYISHVGIYLGNGMLAQASSPREGIIVSSAYYRTPICVVSLLD